MGIVTDLIYIVGAALFGGVIAHFLKQPLVLGYILAGVIVGPYTGGVTIQNIHEVEMLAEIGVALLLFTLGLEFSFTELKRLARITFLGTPVQIVLSAVAGYGIAQALGLSYSDSVWIGAAMSLSSTMVVLKTLAARNVVDTEAGRVMLAVLIAQDLAVVPLLLVVPQLTGAQINVTAISSALVKSVLFLGVMYIAGTRFIPRIFAMIARRGSRELFSLVTLATAFGAGYLSNEFGLSFALGAFVAGMLLSETEFNHQALSDVAALRDLFALIFFVSVGMLFDPGYFASNVGLIMALAVALILSKGLIMAGIVRLSGYDRTIVWTAGLGLSQIGEFAFVVLKAGNSSGQMAPDTFSLMIAVTVVSMTATPLLFSIAARFAASTKTAGRRVEMEEGSKIAEDLREHVIIVGAGFVGRYVAKVLASLDRSFVVVDLDYQHVFDLRAEGVKAVYGDASSSSILEAVGIERAGLVVVTIADVKTLSLIVSEIRRLRSDIPLVVHAKEADDVDALASLDVDEIVQPHLEAGLEMVRQSLLSLGFGEAQIIGILGRLRSEHYELRSDDESVDQSRLLRAMRLLELVWIDVRPGGEVINKTLEQSGLREKYGVSIVAIVRGDDCMPVPNPQVVIQPDDVLGVLGTREQVQLLRKINERGVL